MKLTMKELQSLETEMLKEVAVICQTYSILYFIAYGSSLGALRHKGPIPWDSDVDIIIPYSQKEKFIYIIRKKLSEKFFLDYHDINPYYTNMFPRIGVNGYSTINLHLDVFIACGLPNAEDEQLLLINKLNKLSKIHYYKIANSKYTRRVRKRHILKTMFLKTVYSYISVKKVREKFDATCNENHYDDSDYVVNSSGGYGKKEVIPKYFLGNGKLLTYTDFLVNAPEEIEQYLTHFYDDYMTFPEEKERIIKDFYDIPELKLNESY